MNRDIERRVAMRRLGWAALLPFAALGLPAGGARAAGSISGSVRVPSGDFLLERVLTRGLSDGAAIVVTRRWRIAFASRARGMEVGGAQVFADVAAPASLAPLADIERARQANELFPLALDDAGLIADSAHHADPAPLERALDTGRALIAALPLAEAERADARAFMAHLAGMGADAVSRLPRDLFFPQVGVRSSTRALALADGATGTITITASASAAATGLLLASERRIMTRLDGSERLTAERWELSAA